MTISGRVQPLFMMIKRQNMLDARDDKRNDQRYSWDNCEFSPMSCLLRRKRFISQPELVLKAALFIGDDLGISRFYNTCNLPWKVCPRSGRKNYYDAQEFCNRNGGNLVSIHSQEENNFLMKNSNNFVTGLRYSENEKQFHWIDNSTFDFRKLTGKFQKRCGHFGTCVKVRNHNWDNAGCYRKLRWICQKKPLVIAAVCPEQNSEPLLDGGLLKSPGYPSRYFIGTSTCYYNLIVKTDELITIIFNKTDLYYDPTSKKFDHDEIEVYEGFEDDAKLIGRVTGITEPGTVFETEKLNEMTIRFRSGSGTNRTGVWLATWFAKPNNRLRYAEAYRKYMSSSTNQPPSLSLKSNEATEPSLNTLSMFETTFENPESEKSSADASSKPTLTSFLSALSSTAARRSTASQESLLEAFESTTMKTLTDE
uniref:C-type lectin domain-containing protein n=1 Tax=Syphacia muris TaxID=451379 RepID=A0A0N5AJC0_9BILA